MKAAIFSRATRTSRDQVYPFHLYKEVLADTLRFNFVEIPVKSLSDINVEEANKYDVVFVQLKIPPQRKHQLNEIFDNLHGVKILLDDRDSSGQCALHVVPHVDVYIKKQILSDLGRYKYEYPSGRIHAALVMGNNLKDGAYCETIQIPFEFERKLCVGWNIGVARFFYERICLRDDFMDNERPVDVSFRLTVERPKKSAHLDWYSFHREQCKNEVQKLFGSLKVIVSTLFLPQNDYYAELQQSKICPSPWGLGEICYRDFEIIASGALLVKPQMDHIITYPNIYIPNETYIQTNVDFSDLGEICRYYASNENERKRIVRNALEVYRDYFKKQKFVEKITNTIQRIC